MKIDAAYIGLALMVASAILVVAVLWIGFSVLLSFHGYIEGVMP